MFRLFRLAPNLDATAINRAQQRYFPNLGATRVLMRSWLGQGEIWFLAYSQPCLRWPVSPRSRAAISAGGSYHVVDTVVCGRVP